MKILDTTIRDGSYAVDFKFSLGDVRSIVSKLSRLGIELIEIGHGQGLNASSPEHGISLFSDEEYIKAAVEVAGDSKIGVFCIPGIARLDDIRMARANGLSFIRIGVNTNQVDKAPEFIKEASKQGLTVMCNLMKSYTISPEDFAQKAKYLNENGAEYVYLVDSAGYMLPSDIKNYYDAAKSISNVKLGFHGHNNMGLAVSNSLYCAELGFDLIDCSFQGLGRSIGNASTEMFTMAYRRQYQGTEKDLDIDIPRLLEYGYVALKDISPRDLQHPIELACGYAGFHSGFVKDIYECCVKTNVDPLRLILAYSDIDKRGMDKTKLLEVALNLAKDQEALDDHPYNFREFFKKGYE